MTELEHTLQTLKTIRLSDAERSRMRGELLSYAELHSNDPIPSPVSVATRSFRIRLYSGFAAVLLVIGTVGGTAYAAEASLPGDVLYRVKVSISEPIQTALVPSERGKAAWHAILAERRLEEAAQLAANDDVTPEAQRELAANFNTHAMAAEASAARLERSGDTSGALGVQSDFEARLTAHEQILSVIASHYAAATTTDAEQTHASIQDILALVQTHEQTVTSARLALEQTLVPAGTLAMGKMTASSTARVAVATPSPRRFRGGPTPEARIQTESAERTEEVAHILEHHAALLAKFALPATTTIATSTATTTEEVTVEDTTATTTEPVDERK